MIIDTNILRESIMDLFEAKIKIVVSSSLKDSVKMALRNTMLRQMNESFEIIGDFETEVLKLMKESQNTIKIQ